MSEFPASPSRNTNRSIQSDMGQKTPIIQVTEVFHPDDHDRDNLISPRRLARSDIPTIGVDNFSFDPGEEAVQYDSEDSNCVRELKDLHTPLPNQPIRQGSNSNVFVFDPDCVSLFSRRGSYDRRGSNSSERKGSYSNERRGSYSFDKRRGSGLSGGNNSNLTVPSLRQIRTNDLFENKSLAPGYQDSLRDQHMPPQSPGLLSNHSAWSELLDIDTGVSRRSSEAFSDFSRVSNVSSSLSEHLRYLVRAFSSRTEKVKETTLQPASPSSMSDYAGSDALSAISTEPQFRHRLDSFMPDQPEGDTISEIVRFRNEQEEEQKKKSRIPRWIRKLKFPHVIEPQSKLYLFWLFIVTLAFMYNSWAIPLRAAFPYQTPDNVKYWLVFDYICDVIYVMDICLFKMRISFLNSGMKETHRSKTRANYIQKSMFKFDCLSLLPLDLLYLIEMKVNPWCRLPRVLKIQTFWEFYSRCDHLVRSAHAVRVMRTFTYMLFLIHIETCGYYAMSVHEGIGSNEWVYDGQGNAYIRCFYLATKTATSIGNNPDPTNTQEYMFMTVYWVSGVFVFAILIGQIRDIFDASTMVKTTYNHRMDKALNYVKNMNIPKDTQDRVRSWFIYNWQQQKVIDERKMLDALPMKLRKDLAIHVHFNTLSKVKLFSDCDKTLLYDLVLKLKPILFLPGDYVCRKGEIGKEMYIVSQGIVEVVGGPNNSLVLATLKEGSVFGEISLLAMAAEGNRRTADVRCKGFTNLFILSKIDFENAMKDYPEAHKLLKKRAKKLLRMNARIERQSQCSVDQMKIKPENIISTPPETPKLVQTVLQVMDPESTLVRKLSSRRGSNRSEKGQPKDHKKKAGQVVNAARKSQEEVEAFYDDMLKSKDWSDELEKLEQKRREIDEEANKDKGEPDDIDIETATEETGSQKKKISNTSESSADSGVQDTKMTSSCSSAAHSISNKDSKESFGTELGEILEDPGDGENKHTDGKINYTMDMFGDIESQPGRPKSSENNRRNNRFITSGKRGGGGSTARNNDEYTQAFAHGFTIIIDAVDEKEIHPRDRFSANPTDSDDEEQGEVTVNGHFDRNGIHNRDGVDLAETSNGFDLAERSKEVKLAERYDFVQEVNEEEESSQSSDYRQRPKGQSKNSSRSTSIYNNSADRKLEKPNSASNIKHIIQRKKKHSLNQQIIENEDMFAPYRKSAVNKTRATTNKARQLHSVSQKNSCEQKNSSTKLKSLSKMKNCSDSDKNDIENCENLSDDSIRNLEDTTEIQTIHVGEADDSDSVDNSQNDSIGHTIVTCFADVHRETTLSPKPIEEEMASISHNDTLSAPARQRKISVISIGSVLKDGKETLV